MTGGDSADALETTFSLVANDIRLDILRTLWDSYTGDPTPDPEPVPFSTLKERVGVRDSGQFHYHLNKLVPQYVSHHENGYILTYVGSQIIGVGVSGLYTNTDATLDARAIGECSTCGGTLDLRYEQGHAIVDCDSCEATHTMFAPPILVGAHDVAANPDIFGAFTQTQLHQTIRGFCYLCSGPVQGAVVEASLDGGSDETGSVTVVYECTECGAPFYTTATMVVLEHPAIISLLHDAGIDYRELPPWEVMHTVDSDEQIRDGDPVRVEVTVTVADTERTIILDETLDVVEYS